MNQKCKTCVNVHSILSESDPDRVCCLGKDLAFLCLIGKVDRHTTPRKETDEPTEGGGQK